LHQFSKPCKAGNGNISCSLLLWDEILGAASCLISNLGVGVHGTLNLGAAMHGILCLGAVMHGISDFVFAMHVILGLVVALNGILGLSFAEETFAVK